MSVAQKPTIDVQPKSFEARIYYDNGKWVVGKLSPISPTPNAAMLEDMKKAGIAHPEWPNKFRGDTVTWILDTKGRPGVSAHFQFPPKLFADNERLTRDMTADIPPRNPNPLKPGDLTLTLHKDADRRSQPHYYAVWIVDSDGKGQYAVGHTHNPPPEINVGP